MGSEERWIVPLERACELEEREVGGKARNLSRLIQSGFTVPRGFCITGSAYDCFLSVGNLRRVIRMELGRKSFETMRWEEIWDAALRIRSAFQQTAIPEVIATSIEEEIARYESGHSFVVRSSAPGEDSENRSFAGLHESIVGVVGIDAILASVRTVWSSLWSDAALLYRREIGLDPSKSRMAVVVQQLVEEDCSGVAFGRDPRNVNLTVSIVEAVPGLCRDLVDGAVDPDRWTLSRNSGEVLDFRAGQREDGRIREPLLRDSDLQVLQEVLNKIEGEFGWPPDLEWTGKGDRLTLLQARPISTIPAEAEDDLQWYLTLRPGGERLGKLCQRVAQELIPQLEAEGERFANEPLNSHDNGQLAAAIEERLCSMEGWEKIYRDSFIPFAHGVRRLGVYYNDAVRPSDPYEFVGLLEQQPMIAANRNRKMRELADAIKDNRDLQEALEQWIASAHEEAGHTTESLFTRLKMCRGGEAFTEEIRAFLDEFLDIAYGDDRLCERPDLIVATLLEMSKVPTHPASIPPTTETPSKDCPQLEKRLLQAVGRHRETEAIEVLEIARLSWRLRDDDNLLMGRLKSQVLRALECGLERLKKAGRADRDAKANPKYQRMILEALRDPQGSKVVFPPTDEGPEREADLSSSGVQPRQLVGQPASPGLATGKVRKIETPEDLRAFRAGEVLVCDAIQPNMTHIVPLAAAVIERRGGMLIHGAIIARELKIPCVNGISDLTQCLVNGDEVTVDGHLGIVIVGHPEFTLERS